MANDHGTVSRVIVLGEARHPASETMGRRECTG